MSKKEIAEELNKKACKLRLDIADTVYRAKAGHIGGDLSVIDILTTLYYHVLKTSPDRSKDPNRDRFLLSKGHCADALYCVLGDLGYFDLEEMKASFEQFGSRYIGHPSKDVPGVELNSGSLGHGISVGVGMAMAAKLDGLDYRTYVVCGDGEMAEGSNYEGLMAAAHYHLDNFCVTVDVNGLQISGSTSEVMDLGNLKSKLEDFGFCVIDVEDGNDCGQLLDAYEKAGMVKGRPTAVLAHTVKGKGISFMENEYSWHHGVMNEAQYRQAVSELLAERNQYESDNKPAGHLQ